MFDFPGVSQTICIMEQINIPDADYAEVGRQLCGGLSINSTEPQSGGGDTHPISQAMISVVTSRVKQNMILFAKTEFLRDNVNSVTPSSLVETY